MRTRLCSHPARRSLLRATVVSILAAGSLAATACSGTRQEGEAGAQAPEREPTTILVDNRSFLDHNVYVLRGSQRIRLGTATGNGSHRFTIPRNLVHGVVRLSFMVDPIGAQRAPVSNEITVTEGDEVRLTIPPS